MFEDKEEVKKAVMELKLFGGGIGDFGSSEEPLEMECSDDLATPTQVYC